MTVTLGPLDDWGALQLSADGRFLVCVTKTKALKNDTNGTYDVYLYDSQLRAYTLVSRSFNTTNAANGPSYFPRISPTATISPSVNAANNLVPNDTNSAGDIFLYDRVNDTTILISANQAGVSTANHFPTTGFQR